MHKAFSISKEQLHNPCTVQSSKLRAAGQSDRDANQLRSKHFPTTERDSVSLNKALWFCNCMSIRRERSRWKVIGQKGGTKVSGKCIQGKRDRFHVPIFLSSSLNIKQKNQWNLHLFSIFSACCSEILTPRSRRDWTISWASMRPAKISQWAQGHKLQDNTCTNPPMSMRKVFTIILFIQTLENQSQLLFMVLEIVNKFLKIQLSIQVFVSSLHNFLFRKQPRTVSSFVHSDRSIPPYTIFKKHFPHNFDFLQKVDDRIVILLRELSSAVA